MVLKTIIFTILHLCSYIDIDRKLIAVVFPVSEKKKLE